MAPMIGEYLVDEIMQYAYHKNGEDIFQRLAKLVSDDFKRHSIEIGVDQVLEAFNRKKVGCLTFMVGEHTVKWTFE